MISLKIFYDLKAWECVEQDNCDGGVNFGKMIMIESKYDYMEIYLSGGGSNETYLD